MRKVWSFVFFCPLELLCELCFVIWSFPAGLARDLHSRDSRLPHPPRDPHVLSCRVLKVLQVLSQSVIVELRKKLRLRRGVVMTDVVDQLTFAHDGFTFATRGMKIG
jgi:hypothetical protein